MAIWNRGFRRTCNKSWSKPVISSHTKAGSTVWRMLPVLTLSIRLCAYRLDTGEGTLDQTRLLHFTIAFVSIALCVECDVNDKQEPWWWGAPCGRGNIQVIRLDYGYVSADGRIVERRMCRPLIDQLSALCVHIFRHMMPKAISCLCLALFPLNHFSFCNIELCREIWEIS